MKRQEATNTFQEGMVMDFNPLTTPNNIVTNCLNGTLLTFNGNEYVLQNDMGNGRVETAYLPEGYVPLGTAELGGIIYIVSYNPLIDKCQIGCFPSPERNITSDEIQTPATEVTNSQFKNDDGKIINTILKVKLLSDPNSEDGLFKLNPGDKYTIYSTNKGITNNTQETNNKEPRISDVGNSEENEIVDFNPRTVTIHVVSISDDGKIEYLDSSLKWFKNANSLKNYYIKEVNGENQIQDDIDNYRSLVDSAYNVFTSRTSGELALLFELKVIDTFSVTWDASVEELTGSGIVNGRDSEATITFYINYTSPHKNVNLAHVLLTKSNDSGTKRLTGAPLGIIYNGRQNKYFSCSFLESTDDGKTQFIQQIQDRENTGADQALEVEVGRFKYDSSQDLSSYVWEYELTPAMKFGYLDYLSQKGSINFLEIGSGKIELDEWRYYIDNNNFCLNWGLIAYPRRGEKIHKVTMTFIPFYEIDDETISTVQQEFREGEASQYPQYTIRERNSYSGFFQELIPFETSNAQITGEIQKDSLYLAVISIDCGPSQGTAEPIHYYRWLYTTKQWNDEYLSGKTHFEELSLQDILVFKPNMKVEDSIRVETHIPQIEFPFDDYKESNQPYVAAGAQMTTVNYDQSKSTFLSSKNIRTEVYDPTIEIHTKNGAVLETQLFKFEPYKDNKCNIKKTDTNITHSPIVPISDTHFSNYLEQVAPKIEENKVPVILNTELRKAMTTNLENGIETNEQDNTMKDSFSADLYIDSSDDRKFDLAVYGVIFSRINADFKEVPVTIGQIIRPLLLYKDDFEKLGLYWYDLYETIGFPVWFEETHYDGGSGDPFMFHFSQIGGANAGWSIANVKKNPGSNQIEWNPGDSFEVNYWKDIPPYSQGLNGKMLELPGSFQSMYYKRSDKECWYRDTQHDLRGRHQLWVKTTGNHYLPIKFATSYGESQSIIANPVAELYAQLYYGSNGSTTMTLPIVSNINYVTNYSETWNIDINIKIDTPEINKNIIITDKNGNSASIDSIMSKLSEKIKSEEIDITNLQYLCKSISFDQTISHTFYIQNTDLYDQYNSQKSNAIPAIAYLSTSSTPGKPQKCEEISKERLHFQKYNEPTPDFVEVNSLSAKEHLRFGGSVSPSSDDLDSVLRLTQGNLPVVYASLYDAIDFSNNELKFNETKLLQSTVAMEFITKAGKGVINKNPTATLY